jgi:hypothetical protein
VPLNRAWGSLFDAGEVRMSFVKNLWGSSKRDSQPRTITKEPPTEKRQQPRFTSQFRSTISGGQGEGQGRTLDLSTGGCMIETDFPVVAGASFEDRRSRSAVGQSQYIWDSVQEDSAR